MSPNSSKPPRKGGPPSGRRGQQRRDGEQRGGRGDGQQRGGQQRRGQQRGGRGDDAPFERRELPKGQPGWGRVARKGADAANRDDNRDHPQPGPAGRPAPQERWNRVEGRPPANRGRKTPSRRPVKIDPDSLDGVPRGQRDRVAQRLGDAARAFSDERFDDARRTLAPLVDRHPGVPEVRELMGLTHYRMGRWKPAIGELEAWYLMTGSTEQHPVMADAHRALGHHDRVEELWDELRHDHPDAEVITEGRIVLAGSKADRGDLTDAIRVLEQGPVRTKAPREHHLRLWYALADLYERAGDSQRARRGFQRVADVEPGFADVDNRLVSLG